LEVGPLGRPDTKKRVSMGLEEVFQPPDENRMLTSMSSSNLGFPDRAGCGFGVATGCVNFYDYLFCTGLIDTLFAIFIPAPAHELAPIIALAPPAYEL